MLRKVLSAFGFGLRRKADISALIALVSERGELGNNPDFESLVKQGYKRNSAVYGAIQAIATNAATVPWVAQKESNGETEDVPDHPLVRLLERPNSRQSGSRFFLQHFTYLHIAGRAYMLRARDDGMGNRGRRTRTLWNLRPDCVRLVDENEPERGWLYQVKGKPPTPYEFEDVWPWYLLDPLSDTTGLSPIEVARASINQGNYSREWNKALLKNAGRSSGVLSSEDDLDIKDEDIEKIQKTFNSRVGGDSVGKVLVSRGKLSYQPMGFSPGDMDWLDGTLAADRATAYTFGVPSILTGDTEASTFNNYQEARRQLYEDKIIPLLEWTRDDFNVWLTPEYGDGAWLDFNLDGVDALQEARVEKWERVGKSSWISLNEKREATGYEGWGPAGDLIIAGGVIVTPTDVLVPATLLPIGEAGRPVDGGQDDNGGAARRAASAYIHLRRKGSKLELVEPSPHGTSHGSELSRSVRSAIKNDGLLLPAPDDNEAEDDELAELALEQFKQTGTSVQSVICSKTRFKSADAARAWVAAHDFKADKLDDTETSYRFRQFPPGDCQDNSFRTITITRGVKAAICKKKKSFNLRTPDGKTAHWKAVEGERQPFVRLARFQAANRLNADRALVVSNIRRHALGDPDVATGKLEAVLAEHYDEWQKFYLRLYLTVGEHFARRVLGSIAHTAQFDGWAGAALSVTDWKQEPDVFDPFDQQLRAYLSQEAGRKITGIANTTLGAIRRQLIIGVGEGEGIDKLADRIDKYLVEIIPHRAEVIARTEVVAASNAASDFAAAATGVARQKEWIATRDTRTRDPHAAADGKIVPVEDPFIVDGEQLRWPGDTSLGASVGNVVQCRCALGYLTE